MSENKCCGNCKHFVDKEVGGYGLCNDPNMIYGTHRSNKACSLHQTMSSNGWTQITPDNVDELYPVIDRVIVAYKLGKGLAGYSSLTELYKPLKDLALTGGYYFFILPELKIE